MLIILCLVISLFCIIYYVIKSYYWPSISILIRIVLTVYGIQYILSLSEFPSEHANRNLSRFSNKLYVV